jgi:hypothetical protein
MRDSDAISGDVIDVALRIHRELGARCWKAFTKPGSLLGF